jgi:hypothetical protein
MKFVVAASVLSTMSLTYGYWIGGFERGLLYAVCALCSVCTGWLYLEIEDRFSALAYVPLLVAAGPLTILVDEAHRGPAVGLGVIAVVLGTIARGRILPSSPRARNLDLQTFSYAYAGTVMIASCTAILFTAWTSESDSLQSAQVVISALSYALLGLAIPSSFKRLSSKRHTLVALSILFLVSAILLLPMVFMQDHPFLVAVGVIFSPFFGLGVLHSSRSMP